MCETSIVYLHPYFDSSRFLYKFWKAQPQTRAINSWILTFIVMYQLFASEVALASVALAPLWILNHSAVRMAELKQVRASKIELIRLVHGGGLRKEPHAEILRVTDQHENEIALHISQVKKLDKQHIEMFDSMIGAGSWLVWADKTVFEIQTPAYMAPGMLLRAVLNGMQIDLRKTVQREHMVREKRERDALDKAKLDLEI